MFQEGFHVVSGWKLALHHNSVLSHIFVTEQKAQPWIENIFKMIALKCLKSHVLLSRPPLRFPSEEIGH